MKNLLLFALLSSVSAFGQAYSDSVTQNSPGNYGRPVPYALVLVCSISDTSTPCTTKINSFTDDTLGVACTQSASSGVLTGAPSSGANCNNPGIADANGNFTIYVVPGQYRICTYANNWLCQNVSIGGSGGGIPFACASAVNGSIVGMTSTNTSSCDPNGITDFIGHWTSQSYRATGAFNGTVELTGGLTDPTNPPDTNSVAFLAPTAVPTPFYLRPPASVGTVGQCLGLLSQDIGTNGTIDALQWQSCLASTGVTSFSAGNLSPLFTTSVATATTTPALTFALSNAAANTIFGNFTGSSGAPSYNAVSACGDSTHALKWTAGTGFGCQLISVGATTEVQVNGSDTTAQTPISFNDSTTITFSNPSAGNIQATVVPAPQATNPTAPTLTTNGSAGSTSYSYKIVGCEDGPTCAYHSAATSAAAIATGNATLTSSNSINLTTYANTLYGYRCYNVYRTASAGTPSSTGLIANCVWKQFIDTGLAGDSSTAPTTNTTVLDANGLTNPLPGCNKLPGAPYGIDGPPCVPVVENDEFTWGNGAFLPGDVNNPQWTWLNQNSCTVTLTNGLMSISCPAHAATNINCLLTPVPGSTPYTFVGTFAPNSAQANSNSNDFESIAFYEQSSGKLYLLGHNDAGVIGTETALYKMTSTTVFSATANSGGVPYANFMYDKLQNDGTNLKFSMSPDGITYTQIFSEAKNTFFTTAPSHVGFCLDSFQAVGMDIDYFRRTQ